MIQEGIIHETDLLKIGFTTKQMNVVDFAQGFVLKARGDEYLKDDKSTAKHFYNLALQKYEDSLHANPYNKWTLVSIPILYKLFCWVSLI